MPNCCCSLPVENCLWTSANKEFCWCFAVCLLSYLFNLLMSLHPAGLCWNLVCLISMRLYASGFCWKILWPMVNIVSGLSSGLWLATARLLQVCRAQNSLLFVDYHFWSSCWNQLFGNNKWGCKGNILPLVIEPLWIIHIPSKYTSDVCQYFALSSDYSVCWTF